MRKVNIHFKLITDNIFNIRDIWVIKNFLQKKVDSQSQMNQEFGP
jgi:hypothetical protein